MKGDLTTKADELDVLLDGQEGKIAELRRLIAKERAEILKEQQIIQARQGLIIRAEGIIEQIETESERGRTLAAVAREWDGKFVI